MTIPFCLCLVDLPVTSYGYLSYVVLRSRMARVAETRSLI